MNYSPRYTYYLFKAGVDLTELPGNLTELIERYDNTLDQWLASTDSRKSAYRRILEAVDAFISVKIFLVFQEKFSSETISASDKLKALKAQAAKLKFD